MSEISINANGICKSYKSLFGKRSEVLKDISLIIEAEEIFGILGPNGSGKTTLISIFSTLIYPEEGSLSVLGMDPRKDKDAIRRLINISTAKPNFPWSLTVEENLKHYAMLYGMYGTRLAQSVKEQLDAFELEEYKEAKFENLSTGLKQRLSLAKAMLNSPRLIFLDEPTTGLDPEIAIKTRQLISKIHRESGVSVVLSTHYMPEAEMLCDRVAFLRHGQVVALDTPQNLKTDLQLGERLSIRYEGSIEIDRLNAIAGVMSSRVDSGRAEIIIDRKSGDMGQIMKLFSEANILDIEIKEPDLEDVFLELAK